MVSISHRRGEEADLQETDELREVIEEFMKDFSKLADSFDLTPASGTKMVFHFGATDNGPTYEIKVMAADFEIEIDLTELALARAPGH